MSPSSCCAPCTRCGAPGRPWPPCPPRRRSRRRTPFCCCLFCPLVCWFYDVVSLVLLCFMRLFVYCVCFGSGRGTPATRAAPSSPSPQVRGCRRARAGARRATWWGRSWSGCRTCRRCTWPPSPWCQGEGPWRRASHPPGRPASPRMHGRQPGRPASEGKTITKQ